MMKNILIVDDDPSVVAVLTRLLSGAGCRTRSAGGADEAIALAAVEDFDAIMLDLVLRGASGYSAIAPLKKMSGAPILVMTGNADAEIEKDVRLMGADGLIGKPFELRRLAALLRELTGASAEGAS
jgi:DNA-binding response OmpR family regulator